MKKNREIREKINFMSNGFAILMICSMISSVVSMLWIPRTYSIEEINRILYVQLYFFLGCIFGAFAMILSLASFVIAIKEKAKKALE
jgi:hypothetical protein